MPTYDHRTDHWLVPVRVETSQSEAGTEVGIDQRGHLWFRPPMKRLEVSAQGLPATRRAQACSLCSVSRQKVIVPKNIKSFWKQRPTSSEEI
jgi:hypothetical protein